MALVKALLQRDLAVDVLSRGYGRTNTAAEVVEPSGLAENFGDEPLLIARTTGVPVYVARRRYEAGCLAESALGKKTIHLLDDGFQHRQLHRALDFLLLSQRDLDDVLLPAGNLREPLTALRRASVLVIPAEEAGLESRLRGLGWTGPIWKIRRRMELPPLTGPVVAFCGIARPEQFFLGLEERGVPLVERRVFRDHRPYRAAELVELAALARRRGATLLTTEKDMVRIGLLAEEASISFGVAKLVTEIQDEAPCVNWLLEALQRAR